MDIDYVSGLDLGQAQEYTALAVLERTTRPEAEAVRPVGSYAVRHLERFPVGTAYPEIFARVVALFVAPPLAGTRLAVDLTGVGRPVLGLLRRTNVAARLRPVLLTAGHQAGLGTGAALIPKVELASTLQVLLQSRRLKVAPGLPDAPPWYRS